MTGDSRYSLSSQRDGRHRVVDSSIGRINTDNK